MECARTCQLSQTIFSPLLKKKISIIMLTNERVSYWLSRLSEFDRIIGNDRIDACLNVFISALIVTVISRRSTGLLMARVLRLLSFACFHELCLALASLGLFIRLHEYRVILKEIEDRRWINMLRWLPAVFLDQLRRWTSIIIPGGNGALNSSLHLDRLLLLLLMGKICRSRVGVRPVHILVGLLLYWLRPILILLILIHEVAHHLLLMLEAAFFIDRGEETWRLATMSEGLVSKHLPVDLFSTLGYLWEGTCPCLDVIGFAIFK